SISLIIALILICISSGAFASFSDVAPGASYYEAVNHLKALGIINGNEKGEFKPEDYITREQFARLVIAAAGEETKAEVLSGVVLFPDVGSDRWSCGFINAASQLGYIKGMLDGKFHPTERVTYSQVCTVLVKMLGYNDNDLPGVWPQNYLVKAKEIGITDKLSFSSNDALPRWAVAVMLDNLLKSPVKSDTSKTYSDVNKHYTEYIILGTYKTSDKLTQIEILTDKGTLYVEDSKLELEPGKKYRLNIQNNTVKGIISDTSNVLNISVESSSGTTVFYKEDNISKSISLPGSVSYYYNGKEQKFEDVYKLLETNSSIVLNKSSKGAGYEYAVIFDPVYSSPQVAGKYNLSDKKIGSIKLEDGMKITRNGEMIKAADIDAKDVLYQVSDIWGNNKYLLAIDNSVTGELTAILPNKVSPKSVEINGKSYELGEYMNYDKLNSKGILKVGDSVTALLGHDGKVSDIIMSSSEDNAAFALVINNYTEKSTDIEDFGKEVYYIKLLHTDNSIKTYKLKNEEIGLGGELVKYRVVENADTGDTAKSEEKKTDYGTVEIERLSYIGAKEYVVDKRNRKLDSNYFSDNIKVFNIVSKVSGGESEGYLIDWSDLPDGKIEPGKVRYLNMTGDFEDINVMYVDNIFDEGIYLGIVTESVQKASQEQKSTAYTNTLLVNGKKYTTNHHIEGMYEGTVVLVRISSDRILAIESIKAPWAKSTTVNAIDSKRIKINGTVYEFSSNTAIYFKDYGSDYLRKGSGDISKGIQYGRVELYFKKSPDYGGKAELVIISQ
ncbi:MAG: S-layer homology domain-containing protein, partial [Clostridiaceae bacterium]|nr:S-layer homology domain-containing protein [Clostridiaceae bacterium]